MPNELNEKTRTPLNVTACIVSFAVGIVVTAYGIRDKAMADIRSEITATVAQERVARQSDLKHFLTREEYLKDAASRDRQLYEIKNLLLTIKARR